MEAVIFAAAEPVSRETLASRMRLAIGADEREQSIVRGAGDDVNATAP